MNLESIAREIAAAQREVRQIAPFTTRYAQFDNHAAYQVARQLHERRIEDGWVATGRKIGFTNPDMWALYGVHEPIWSYVYGRTVILLERNEPLRCALTSYCEPKIEPEIVLHFRSAPPAGADPRALLECIDWVAHGIEIVQSHYPGWAFRAPDAIADSALHAALFVGEQQDVGDFEVNLEEALKNFTLELSCNGALRERGRGANVLGSPLSAVCDLLVTLAGQPGTPPIAAGELITTGTLTTAHSVSAGQTWETRLGGISLPGMELTLDE